MVIDSEPLNHTLQLLEGSLEEVRLALTETFLLDAPLLLSVCTMVAVRPTNFLVTRHPNLPPRIQMLFLPLEGQVGFDILVVRVMGAEIFGACQPENHLSTPLNFQTLCQS